MMSMSFVSFSCAAFSVSDASDVLDTISAHRSPKTWICLSWFVAFYHGKSSLNHHLVNFVLLIPCIEQANLRRSFKVLSHSPWPRSFANALGWSRQVQGGDTVPLTKWDVNFTPNRDGHFFFLRKVNMFDPIIRIQENKSQTNLRFIMIFYTSDHQMKWSLSWFIVCVNQHGRVDPNSWRSNLLPLWQLDPKDTL